MNTLVKIVLPFLFTLTCSTMNSQNEFVMGTSRSFIANSGVFYDDGGKDANVSNVPHITTLESLEGSIEIYFSEFDIPDGAEIRIYNGKDTNDQLITIFRKGDKIFNIKFPAITLQYVPSNSNSTGKGWRAIIFPSIITKGQQVSASKPESDCPNAIAICSNTTINTSANQYTDTGIINDDAGTCYSGTGSGGSVWYTFTPQSNGPLDFAIAPLGTTDYDFVLYDITAGCSNKVELSCNFSSTTGSTGLSSLGSTNSEPASGVVWCQRVNVVTTKKYALCINYYGGTNGGFSLTFKNEASSVSIWDLTPPTILNAYTANCSSTTTLMVTFSEQCQCTTIQNSDFTIAGYSFTVSNTYCNSNNGSLQVALIVSPALTSGTYTMNATNILDMCGNNMNSNYVIVLGTPPSPTISVAAVVCKNPGFLGIGFVYSPSSQVLTGGGGTTYIWNGSVNSPTLNVSPTSTAIYTVTALQGACAGTATRQVIVEQVIANAGPDQTICAGFPTLLSASGGGTYQWQSGTSASGPWTNIGGATSNTFSVSPATTIWYRVLVTGPNGCTSNDVIKITTGAGSFGITTSKPYACQGENITLTLPSGITSYTWSTGTNPNAPLVIAPMASTSYTATSTTAGCIGSASITIPVRLNPIAVATASPITACIGTPVTLSATPTPSSSTTTSAEDFEGASMAFTLVNGVNNKWYHGNFNKCNGLKSLYVGTGTTDNNYINFSGLSGKAATNYAYKDYSITGYCSSDLTFNWKCLGKTTDYLSVWIVPTTVTPVAGTALVASPSVIMVGGPYWNAGASCNSVTISLSQFVGQSVRLVYCWQNTAGSLLTGNTAASPAALVDDIILTQINSYGYSWTSNPSGLSSTMQNVTATPTVATDYSLTVTRCDGCVSTATTAVGNCLVLPVELISFSGDCNNNVANLSWATASEKNNNYFVIEKSADGNLWTETTRVFSEGNSKNIKHYAFEDSRPLENVSYYRLVQVDKNQNSKVIGIISIDCIQSNPSVIYFPNPVNSSLTLFIQNIKSQNASVIIYNVLGQKINEFVLTGERILTGKIEIDVSVLSAGAYYIRFETRDFTGTKKIIKSD